MSVPVIRANPFSEKKPFPPLLKVAAYCRVSTDSEEQESSYDAQRTHYYALIQNNPDWAFAGIYADEGISGTQAKKRPQFLKMIDACLEHKIDLVITKSISRFSRNTLDCLQYVRLLKEQNIAVFFEKENINTLDIKGEILITIMASIAQQESASISQNVAMGIRYKMQRGIGRINYTRFMGYTKDYRNGPLRIVPEEADIVRRIFREYLDGFTPAMIAKHLQAEQIPAPSGGEIWHPSTVFSMLKNEKYCGDFLMQKTFTEDFLTKKIRKNTGQLPQYYVENHHPPIIPKEVFLQVQGEMLRRSVQKNDPTKLRCSSTISLCGRIICGRCGKTLKRYTRPEQNLTDWRCHNRAYPVKTNHQARKSACGCRFVSEAEVQNAVISALNQLPLHWASLLQMDAECHTRLQEIDVALSGCFSPPEEAPLKNTHEALLLERAGLASLEHPIRLLLELIDLMSGHFVPSSSSYPSSCSDPEDFFLRTRFIPCDELLDNHGNFIRYDNNLVIRYFNTITVRDDGLDVSFRAGLLFHIPLGTVKLVEK